MTTPQHSKPAKPKAPRKTKPKPRAMVVCSFSLPTSFYVDLVGVSDKLRVSRSALLYFLLSSDLSRFAKSLDCLDFSDLSDDMVQNLRYSDDCSDKALLDQRSAFHAYVAELLSGVQHDSAH